MRNSLFLEGIKKLLSYSTILSISGESGTGKTSLALQLIGELLSKEDSCIWVQASEKFPNQRLSQLFEGPKLQEIKNKTYIIPKERPIQTYLEQTMIFQNLIDPDTIFPPNIKIVVIDNISHHLRLELGICFTIEEVCSSQNRFYEEQLFPLISLCNRNSINLVLIHEVTYDPSTKSNRSFFYKLYDRIGCINIILRKKIGTKTKEMEVSFNSSNKLFLYGIDHKGISIY
ncbi:hypothetical protein LCGC14_1673690 [marine sediment metagenome]|uniref:AAA+ ATPase domain-containing protein n=1 Tax=marine sediment metagenome TaxID=412755 RepID=A0A0F9K6G1_9ZZZZ